MGRTLIGSRIRERREAAGLKQAELARRAGISPSYLNLIEHNRRGIAGKVLLGIAAILELELTVLTEGADSALVGVLQSAAAGSSVPVETERVEELISRFPGWAQLIGQLQTQANQYEHTVKILSDRLTHDPFLSESLHEMLSSVTAIRATSGILVQADSMEPLQQRRFQTNINEESGRLSDLSRAMVSYFDELSEGEQTTATPQDEVEAFLQHHSFHFPTLEEGITGAIEILISASGNLVSQSSRYIVHEVLHQYCEDARKIPLENFVKALKEGGATAPRLAQIFDVSVDAVFRRLAFLPSLEELPSYGLIVCDGTGAVLLRKPLPGFALPRYGSACGLWPLYQAMTRPHAMVTASLETPEGRLFLGDALASYQAPGAFGGTQVVRSSMLFRTARREEVEAVTPTITKVGLSCRICPRNNCAVRREPSIHTDQP